jgi:hypothetical protein
MKLEEVHVAYVANANCDPRIGKAYITIVRCDPQQLSTFKDESNIMDIRTLELPMPNGLALKTNGAQAYYPYLTQVVPNVPYRAPAPAGHRGSNSGWKCSVSRSEGPQDSQS